MKKLLVLLLCLMMSICLFSCEDSVTPESNELNESNAEQPSTPDNDSKPKDEPPKVDPSVWKAAYLDFLETKKDVYYAYALVYVDGDDIPELYLNGASQAEGDSVCSYKNGKVIEQSLKRTNSGKYLPRSGTVSNVNGHMGLCYTDVYKLDDNGFTKTFNAKSIEHVEHIGNNEYTFSYEYFIDGQPVSEEEYNAAVNAAFDFDQTVRFDEHAVSYDKILQQINAWKPILSQEVKNTWKSDLIAILSEVDVWDPENSIPGSHAVGLMDLNFDNLPEVLVAWPGGSMGNVHIAIYDLKSHHQILTYNAGHYNDDEIRLYVAEVMGSYVILAEGSLRDPECGWGRMIDRLPTELKSESGYLRPQNLFTQSDHANTNGDGPYFIQGESVSQNQYEEEYEKFLTDYTELAFSEIHMIHWFTLDLSDKDGIAERMADALIQSPQIFLDSKN